jgi:hypothetical protein
MTLEQELEICAAVNRKIHTDDSISDEELMIARKHFRKVQTFLEALNDRMFDLFTDHIRADLIRLDRFHKARRE